MRYHQKECSGKASVKKVCHFTTVHTPTDIRIFKKMCITLAQSGFDTHLLATADHDGVIEGVNLHALKKSASRLERFTKGTRIALERALEINADLYHFHDPELLPFGLQLKKQGKTVIYDAHENHSGSIQDRKYLQPWLRPILARHVKKLENKADQLLDAIVTATPAIARQFRNPNTIAIQNFPLLNEFAQVAKAKTEDRRPQVAFVGGMSEIRGLTPVVQAIAQVPKGKLILAGSFTPASYQQELASLPGWKQTEHHGWLSREDVASLLGQSMAGIVTFLPAQNHNESQPNKIFEYMAAGIPVIGSNFPLWQEIIEKENIGICVDPNSPEQIAQAIQYVLDHPQKAAEMGARGRKAIEEKYSWEAESQKLISLYHKLLD